MSAVGLLSEQTQMDFSATGVLSGARGFEYRPQQQEMACAVARADAKRILLPVNRCDNIVAGVRDVSISELIADAVEKIAECGKC